MHNELYYVLNLFEYTSCTKSVLTFLEGRVNIVDLQQVTLIIKTLCFFVFFAMYSENMEFVTYTSAKLFF